MFKRLNVIIFCLLATGSVAATPQYTITTKNLKKHIQLLSSDALEGRLTGSKGEKLAAQYIATIFSRLGLEPAGDNGTYFQKFRFGQKNKSKKLIGIGYNVLAKLRVDTTPKPLIIIGAHLDHLGRAYFTGSRATTNEAGRIHPGADDNASGVASMLEIATKLCDLKQRGELKTKKDILFAAWSGEEIGILGSTHFVKHISNTTIDAIINLDMLGHLRKNLVVQGVGSSIHWQKLLNDTHHRNSLKFITQSDPYLPTDTTPFYLHRIPAINLFTGAHNNYHTPRDTPATLNYEGIKRISEFTIALTQTLEANAKPLRYRAIAKPKSDTQNGFKVYLGTIPDYASSDVAGVKLSGVAKSSPASAAGLHEGDVIVQLAGRQIHDIYDYAKALNTLKPNKSAQMLVLRGSVKVALLVKPRLR